MTRVLVFTIIPAHSLLVSRAPACAGTKPWQPVGLSMLEVMVVGIGSRAQDALGVVTSAGGVV